MTLHRPRLRFTLAAAGLAFAVALLAFTLLRGSGPAARGRVPRPRPRRCPARTTDQQIAA